MYKVINPILLRFFNRPDKTKKVIDILRKVKPSIIYLYGDGPRNYKGHQEHKLVEQSRIIATQINWKCKIKKKFMDHNLGGPKAGYDSISWFFSSENQGIILEDDCIPNTDFFKFCDELLEYYKDDHRVGHVTGSNFQNGNIRGDATYYFSKYTHTWGWASWRRSFLNWKLILKNWSEIKKSKLLEKYYNDKFEKKYWEKIFDDLNNGISVHWDYSWMLKQWIDGSLTATPNKNLVINIGYDESATHELDPTSELRNLKLEKIENIIHPDEIKVNTLADIFAFDFVYKGQIYRFPGNLLNFLKKIFRIVFRNLNN
jgi:hypothetical protein